MATWVVLDKGYATAHETINAIRRIYVMNDHPWTAKEEVWWVEQLVGSESDKAVRS